MAFLNGVMEEEVFLVKMNFEQLHSETADRVRFSSILETLLEQ